MRPEADQLPRVGDIVMTCAHSHVTNAASRRGQLVKLQGGPRVFANLDDRFFSEWLYFCDDCHAKVRADTREVPGLIHGPMEWIGDEKKCSTALMTNDKKRFPLRFMGNTGY